MFLLTRVVLDRRVYREGCRYRLGDASVRLLKRDIRVLKQLKAIRESCKSDSSGTWLLAHRRHIRNIEHRQPQAALTLAAIHSQDEATRRLAIWLRGRASGKFAARELLELGKTEAASPTIVAEVARALFRIGAWCQLAELLQACRYQDLSQQYECSVAERDFYVALKRFVRHMPATARTASISPGPQESMKLFVASAGNLQGKPAKPKWLIRLVLDRVHWLVSRARSVDRLPREI